MEIDLNFREDTDDKTRVYHNKKILKPTLESSFYLLYHNDT